MKKNIPIVIFLLLFVKLSAQPGPPHLYVPLAVDSANWIVAYEFNTESSPYEYKVYSVIGDTTISNIDYKKIYLTRLTRVSTMPTVLYSIGGTQLFAFVRDSFQVASVFAMHPNTGFLCEPNSNTEYELYDFSVRKNDTVNNCLTNNIDFIIDSTYLKVESSKNRLFFTHNMASTPFIEGIGSDRGLFEVNMDMINDTTTMSEYCYGTLTSCISIALTTEEDKYTELYIYPNPASKELMVDGLNQDYFGIFINSLGEAVKRVDDFSVQIDISDLHRGIYFLKINHLQSGAYIMRKIIIVD